MYQNARVNIVSTYNYPSSKATGNRINYFVTDLINNKYEVTVTSIGPDSSSQFENIIIDKKNINIVLQKRNFKNYLIRGLDELILCCKLLLKVNRNEIVLITIPSVFLLFIFSLFYKGKIIVDIRDITWEYLSNSNFILKYFALVIKKLAKRCLKKSLFILVTNKYEKEIISKIVNKEVIVIPNGISKNKFDILRKENFQMSIGKEKTITYFGNFGKAQKINTLIEAVIDNKNYNVHLIGGGNMETEIKDFIKRKNIKNVNISMLMPWTEMITYYNTTDILFLQIGKEFKSAVPSKIFEYVSTGKIVIAGVPEGPAKKILSMFSGVHFFEPGNVLSLQKVIEQLQFHKISVDRILNLNIVEKNFIRENNNKVLSLLIDKYLNLKNE